MRDFSLDILAETQATLLTALCARIFSWVCTVSVTTVWEPKVPQPCILIEVTGTHALVHAVSARTAELSRLDGSQNLTHFLSGPLQTRTCQLLIYVKQQSQADSPPASVTCRVSPASCIQGRQAGPGHLRILLNSVPAKRF